MAEDFLTVEQAAARLQLHPFTVRRQLQSGRLRGFKRGRVWRVPESALSETAPPRGQPILADLDELMKATGEASKRAGCVTEEDIDRLIDEVRAELGTLASRQAWRELGRTKRHAAASATTGRNSPAETS